MLSSTLHIIWYIYIYAPVKFLSCYVQQFRRRCIYKKVHYLHSTLRSRSNKMLPSTLPHHVTYAPVKFEAATSSSFGGFAFTRKNIIWPWSWCQGHTKSCPVPSTSCDLYTPKVWSCYVQRFWRRRKCIIWSLTSWNVAQFPLHLVTYAPAKFEAAMYEGAGGDTFTRNVTESRTHIHNDRTDGRQTGFATKLIYPFSKEKSGIIRVKCMLT